MDRAGALPDRCIVCNADAGGHRLSRKLYWSPLSWRLAATAAPFVAFGIGAATQTPLLAMLFWPLVLVIMIAHTFVRKRLDLEIGICARHQRWLAAIRALSLACIVGVLASIALWNVDDRIAAMLLWTSLGVMLLANVTQSLVGVPAVALNRLGDQHAWLAGTGKAFRAALPELPR